MENKDKYLNLPVYPDQEKSSFKHFTPLPWCLFSPLTLIVLENINNMEVIESNIDMPGCREK